MKSSLFWAAVLAVALVFPASAQDRIVGTYTTYLGPEDLVNSNGVRLMSAGSIVQQDRANFHRFGIRHSMDQADPWFHNRGHRMAIPHLVVTSPATADVIVRQGAYVAVSVYADMRGQMTRIVVQIPG